MEKVILIDGNNLLFRSYYATAYTGNMMKNSKGFPTNAIYGFTNMINKIISEEKMAYIMVAFDKGKTFRHDKYEVYKAGRITMPEELSLQFPVAKKLLEAMGITYMEIDNYEADDIIGTLAQVVDESKEYNATIISSDKDLLQLISAKVEVKLLKQTGFIRMTKEELKNTYNLEPSQIIDLKALQGDSSDNIPGVKGIGEKTALKLLTEYQSLDNIYHNLDKIKGSVHDKLLADKANAYMSYDIATIYKKTPIDLDIKKLKYHGINQSAYTKIIEELEFYSLLKKQLDNHEKEDSISQQYKIVQNLDEVIIDDNYAIYLEILGNNYHKDQPLGVSIYSQNFNYFIPFELLKGSNIFNDAYQKYTYDLKKILVIFSYYNIGINNLNEDLMIAGYLLNYNVKDDIAYLANNKGYDIPFYDNVYGQNSKLKAPNLEIIAENGLLKSRFIYEARLLFLAEIKKEEIEDLYNNIEIPVAKVLADMEYTGVKIDKDYLVSFGDDIKIKMELLAKEIYNNAGAQFNILSPKQLGDILFIKLGIPYPKKIKDQNYSTSKEILDKITFVHPIIEQITNYRNLAKLYANYIVGLINEIAADGKIHTIFNQTLTRTGRLSSVSPNLQNIPIRLEYGRLVRKAFIPLEDCVILASDYSQIELRIFAHISNAPNLMAAFRNNEDIHTKTAMDIFHVEKEAVTKDLRRKAKAVNFGILYGISGFGLGEDLGIDYKEAAKFIKNYLDAYPGIKEYMDASVKEAYQNGYVKTIMNRKRTIDELKNSNYIIRSSGERMALNTPIQGSSADILKKAMIDIYDAFNKRHLKSKMLIQVHDELVFNVYKNELTEVKKIVEDIMENTYQLKVPIKTDISYGQNWYEAK